MAQDIDAEAYYADVCGLMVDDRTTPERRVCRLVSAQAGKPVHWDESEWHRVLCALVEAHLDDPAFVAALDRMGRRLVRP